MAYFCHKIWTKYRNPFTDGWGYRKDTRTVIGYDGTVVWRGVGESCQAFDFTETL